MADQSERIVLEFPVDQAVKNAGRVNSEIGQVERTSERAAKSLATNAQQTGQSIVTIMDRSRASTERLVASIEARVFGLKPKLEQLAAQRDQALSRVGGDSNATGRINSAFDKLIAKQKEVQLSASGIGDAIAHPLQAAGNAVDGFVGKFGTIGVVAAGAALGIATVAKSAFDLVAAEGKVAEGTINLSEELGVSISEMAVLQAQARISGVGIDSLSGLVRKLSSTLTDNSDEARGTRRALNDMGVDLVDIRGNLRDPISLLRDFSERMDQFPDHAHKVALLNSVFGKGAVALLPLLENFRETEAAARKLGVGLDADLIKNLAKADDELDKLGISWDRIRLKLANTIVGTVQIIGDMPDWLKRLISGASPSPVPGIPMGVFQFGKSLIPEPTSAPLGPDRDRRFESGVNTSDVVRGRALLKDFERETQGSGLEALQNKIKTLEEKRATLADTSTLNVRSSADIIARRQEFRAAGAELTGLRAQLKEMQEAPRKLEEVNKAAADALNKAIEAQMGPMEKMFKRFDEQIEQSRGNAGARGNFLAAQAPEFRSAQNAALSTAEGDRLKAVSNLRAQELAAIEDARVARFKAFTEEVAQQEDLKSIRSAIPFTQLGIEEDALSARHESELKGLEALGATTVQQKLAVEQAKAKIDADYLNKRLALHQQELQLEFEEEVRSKGLTYEEILTLAEVFNEKERRMRLATDEEIAAAQQTAQVNSTKIVVDENQRRLDTLQRQAEGVFDQMVRAWKDGWSGAASFFETLLLTAIKNVVTSQIARTLNGIMGGTGGGGFGATAGGGLLGSLLGGASPAFGAANIGPGGTSGFAGPVQLGGGGGNLGGLAGTATSIAKGGFSASALAGLGIGAAGFGLQGAFKLGQSDNKFGKAAAIPLGAASGLLGFGALTSLFPALIGAGPVGWIAAAGIGATIGLMGLFRKKAEDKIVEKVKSVYGINIDKSFAKDPLMGIIKQNFGGNIDVGIRSPQVRELLELYAMSTGQNPGGLVAHVRSSTFANVGGVLQQLPTYQNGEAVFAGARVSTALNPGGSSGPVVIQSLQVMVGDKSLGNLVDGRAAEVVRSNGKAVAQAAAQGQKDGVARRSATAMLLQPGFRTS